MGMAGPDGGGVGPARAERLIGELEPLHDPHPTAVAFARIIIGLFPDWFDFAPGRFAVLTNGHRGLKLVVTGATRDLAIFPTSDSRCMWCYYYSGRTVESARMDMHYEPRPEHVARARAVVALALHRLFPERGPAPTPAEVVVPAGRVFPPAWADG